MQTPNTPEVVDYIQPTKFLDLHNTRLQTVQLNGTYYLQAADVAEQLGYKTLKELNKVYLRNPDEFDENDTLLATIETAGGPQQVRCYSLEGVYALGMLARTEPAKQFRRVVKKVMKELAITGRVVLRRYYPVARIVDRFATRTGLDNPFLTLHGDELQRMLKRLWRISQGSPEGVFEVDAGSRYDHDYSPAEFYFVRVDMIGTLLSRIFGDGYDDHAVYADTGFYPSENALFHGLEWVGIDYLRREATPAELSALVDQTEQRRAVLQRGAKGPVRMTQAEYDALLMSDDDMPPQGVEITDAPLT